MAQLEDVRKEVVIGTWPHVVGHCMRTGFGHVQGEGLVHIQENADRGTRSVGRDGSESCYD